MTCFVSGSLRWNLAPPATIAKMLSAALIAPRRFMCRPLVLICCVMRR